MATGGGGYPRHGRTTHRKADMPFAATAIEPPPPPAELTAEEIEIWRSIVDRMPPNHFAPPMHPMLVNLCRHIRMARMFARQLREYEVQLSSHALNEKLLRAMMALSRAQANESRTIAMLLSRLKFTYSTSLTKARRSFLTEQRPWDVPDDADEELPQ